MYYSSKNFPKNRSKKYFLIFIFSIITFFILYSFSLFYLYNLSNNNKSAINLACSTNFLSLYSNSTHTIPYLKTSNKSNAFIIGIIEIDKINLHYPILSNANEQSLKIAPCRFAGPMPNEIGNLCIAGHNNIDHSFFGKLSVIDIDDEIKIYDLHGNVEKYHIYKIKEIKNTDFSCTSQNVKNNKQVTLMTCNNLKNTRMIFVAK